jgi:broad specificity phosphatase PhoE
MGRQDADLSTQGHMQAAALADWFRGRDEFRVIGCSPSRRTYTTAALIADALPGVEQPIVDPSLRERDLGEFEGLSADRMVEERIDLGYEVPADPTVVWDGVKGVEQDTRVAIRSWAAVERLRESGGRGATVAAVTHAGVIKALLHYTFDIPSSRPYAFRIGLGSVIILEFFRGHWSIREMWQNPHTLGRYTI